MSNLRMDVGRGGEQGRPRQSKPALRLRRMWARLRGPGVVLQAALLAATAALGVLWLEIPDATPAGKALSVGLLLCWAMLFAWAESAVLILMRCGSLQRVKVWKGALLLVGLGVAFWLLSAFLDAGSLQDAERAERWVTHTWVWHVAGATTLERIEGAAWWMLRLAIAGALLPLAMEGAGRGLRSGWFAAGVRPLGRWLYWVILLGAAATGTVVTRGLLAPRTGLPMLLEVSLVVVTTGLLFVVDVGGLCAVLALTATYLRDGDRVQSGAAAEPRHGQARGQRRRRERFMVGG